MQVHAQFPGSDKCRYVGESFTVADHSSKVSLGYWKIFHASKHEAKREALLLPLLLYDSALAVKLASFIDEGRRTLPTSGLIKPDGAYLARGCVRVCFLSLCRPAARARPMGR